MICNTIKALVAYGVRKHLITAEDEAYVTNGIMDALHVSDMPDDASAQNAPSELEDILAALCDYAYENGIIEGNSAEYRDLIDTRLMGIMTPFPSTVISTFRSLYETDPVSATDWFYELCRANDYIRTYRVKKDVKWAVSSPYGDIDITINLSKPEKDPKAIAAAKSAPQSGYPKCVICHENEGFAGNLARAARQNLRLIPLTLANESWYMQYSPYVYYNEHCIVLRGEHVPMKIEKNTFARLLDFVEYLPHYFLGSNADLPIVGGSILSHDHMQGGHYTFAMEKAPIEMPLSFKGYENVNAGIVRWPMSVIRLSSTDKNALVTLSDKILSAWRSYTDESAFVYAETNGEPHNTITPIARMREGKYELDLVLRNNITTDEHPLGVYHPHAEHHNIKKENIGLIEVMGLAVLPARLKSEMQALADAIVNGEDIESNEMLAKHAAWLDAFRASYTFTKENALDILYGEVGNTFVRVLEDAGVYKCTKEGRAAMMRFIENVNQ